MASDTNGHRSPDPYKTTSASAPPPKTTSPLHLHCGKKAELHLHCKHNCRRGKSSASFSSIFGRRLCLIRYLLLLPFTLYLSGVITCVGPLSAILHLGPPPPGSVYHSHEVFDQLWPQIQADDSPSVELSSIWKYRRKLREHKYSCPNITFPQGTESPGQDRYLIIDANGGLNQQRSSICSAVAVAGLLGATLVIPRFEFHNVWRDSSEFGDIYDEDYFISALKDFVTVVRELPEELMKAYDFNISNIPNFRVQAWAPLSYYLEEIYPILRDQRCYNLEKSTSLCCTRNIRSTAYCPAILLHESSDFAVCQYTNRGVIRISPFANRLSMNVPPQIQFLRCLANYKALRFSSSISTLAQKLVNRMTAKSSISGGKYISVHLRFEEDMVAFSCCVYDGGWSEKSQMDAIREKGWGKKFKSRDRVIAPGLNRVNGRCPMTPLEVGMMLRGMGFANDTSIYLASGKIYQAEKSLNPLRKMFPLFETKETLASADELAEFQGFSSRLAALDYTVCLFSEVFVTTQGGNFPHFLIGHRRFLHNGHAKTIMPDKRKLVLLLHNSSIRWDVFKNEMHSMFADSDRKGINVPRVKKSKRKASIYSNPLPDCQCLWESNNFSSGFKVLSDE